jgi:DNA-binding XRE family transcriptional regulator
MKKKYKKIIYPSFKRYLAQEMKNEAFREAYEKESKKLEIAYQILLLRKKKKMSQAALAKKIGTKQSNVARMEAGEQNFGIDMLQKIAQVFNKDLKVSFGK